MTTAVLAHRVARHSRVASAGLMLAAAALTALAAQWRIPLPFTPVPITGQTFAVLLAGAALGWKLGAGSQALYLAVGIIGAPVFTDSSGGWGVIVGPTGGYLVGFLFAAALVGRMAELGHDRRFATMAGAFLLGSAVIYGFGLLGLMGATGMGFPEAVARGVVPFLIGDLVKAAAAGALVPGLWRLLAD